jgi:predicted heme/steroid binding protein
VRRKPFKTQASLIFLNTEGIFLTETKKITRQELEANNGKNGKPAYLAYKGKVYDVSESSFWLDGDHIGMHEAGKDLTEELEMAPHREENFKRVKFVGDLV